MQAQCVIEMTDWPSERAIGDPASTDEGTLAAPVWNRPAAAVRR